MKGNKQKNTRMNVGGFTLRIVFTLMLALCIVPLVGCEQTEQVESAAQTEGTSEDTNIPGERDETSAGINQEDVKQGEDNANDYVSFEQYLNKDEAGQKLKSNLESWVPINGTFQYTNDERYSIVFRIENGNRLVYTTTFAEDIEVTPEQCKDAAKDSDAVSDNKAIIQSFEQASGVKDIRITYRYFDSQDNQIFSIVYDCNGIIE